MPALDPLTPDQAAILEAFLDRGTSITALAAELGLPLDHLLAQLDRLRPHIDTALELEAIVADRIAGNAATGATGILHDIATDASANPTERRRAATTIARARPARRNNPRRHHPPSSARGGEVQNAQRRATELAGPAASSVLAKAPPDSPGPTQRTEQPAATARDPSSHRPDASAPGGGTATCPGRSPGREPHAHIEPRAGAGTAQPGASDTPAPATISPREGTHDHAHRPRPASTRITTEPPLTPATRLASAAGTLPPEPLDTS